MPASITDRYAALVEAGAIERDPAQVAVVKKLETQRRPFDKDAALEDDESRPTLH